MRDILVRSYRNLYNAYSEWITSLWRQINFPGVKFCTEAFISKISKYKGRRGLKSTPPVLQGTKSLDHGDNSEFSEIFGRTIPNAIFPFSCSSHHDSLRSSQNFENLSIVKISQFWVIVFCAIHKNDNSEFFRLWAYQPLSCCHSTNYERFIENVF